MNDLADKVIAANDAELEESIEQQSPRTDDVGLPLPEPDTEKAWCEYLTARLLYLNKRMYSHFGVLWLDHEPIRESKNSYYRLAHYPKQITDPQCQYVWRRAKELVPELDTSRISVLPNLTFNTQNGEIEHEKVSVVSPWEEGSKK